jgi:hypothetical protein
MCLHSRALHMQSFLGCLKSKSLFLQRVLIRLVSHLTAHDFASALVVDFSRLNLWTLGASGPAHACTRSRPKTSFPGSLVPWMICSSK